MATALALDRFSIVPLTPDHSSRFSSFCCDDEDLEGFLRDDAEPLLESQVSYTYLGLFDQELVGYISLATDAIRLDKKREVPGLSWAQRAPSFIPGLKIGRLATSKAFRENWNGVGKALIAFAWFKGLVLSEHVGIRFLTVDAYPKSADFYAKLGFVHNLWYETQTKTASMRMDLLAEISPSLSPYVQRFLDAVPSAT